MDHVKVVHGGWSGMLRMNSGHIGRADDIVGCWRAKVEKLDADVERR